MRIGSWAARLICSKNLEQRREKARVTAVMDDGQLRAELRTDKGQEA